MKPAFNVVGNLTTKEPFLMLDKSYAFFTIVVNYGWDKAAKKEKKLFLEFLVSSKFLLQRMEYVKPGGRIALTLVPYTKEVDHYYRVEDKVKLIKKEVMQWSAKELTIIDFQKRQEAPKPEPTIVENIKIEEDLVPHIPTTGETNVN